MTKVVPGSKIAGTTKRRKQEKEKLGSWGEMGYSG